MSEPSHPLFARLYDPVMRPAERILLTEHRRYLVEGISGEVLDLGAGTGAMFPYFAEAIADNSSISLTAIEPDPHMLRRAVERAAELGIDIEMKRTGAEALPFDDNSFDVVVASLVFCTIPDFDTAISEVARVLKPGGEFRFLEHVHGRGWYGRLQDAVTPAWRVVAAGCHLNRDTGEALRRHPAFEVADFDRFSLPVPLVTPFVRGRLVHAGGE